MENCVLDTKPDVLQLWIGFPTPHIHPAMLWLQDMGLLHSWCIPVLLVSFYLGSMCPSRMHSLCCVEEFVNYFPLLHLEASKPTAVYLYFFSEKSTGPCH